MLALQCLVEITVFLAVVHSGFSFGDGFYTAAVYEYAGYTESPFPNATDRDTAMKVMNANMDVLESQAGIASSQNADIFVFPEYGITGSLFGLLDISAYLELIPNPVSPFTYCPCHKDYIRRGQEVLHRLSCVAWNTSMYIAANMGDKVPCSRGNDISCPFSGYYYYNTEVVFNRHGCLVAKYHKQHLFLIEKLLWNEPRKVEHSYFDTEFGRFGLMICFDAVYKSPGVDLVEKFNVTDIVFSTAWMNVYPHYISIAYHSGWARMLRVNFLSSNIHHVSRNMLGSGIFSPYGVINYTFNTTSSLGSLVIAKVPINNATRSPKSASKPFTPHGNYDTFSSNVFGDRYKFAALEGHANNLTVCSGSTCCHLRFEREDLSLFYALGVFNGMHFFEGKYFLEVCLLTRCTATGASCGDVSLESVSHFLSYNLTSMMSTTYAFPQVVSENGFNFTTDWDFVDNGHRKSILGKNKSFTSVILMGRNFERDEPAEVIVGCSGAKAINDVECLLLVLSAIVAAYVM